MSAAAIATLERALKLDDIDLMRFEIISALGSLKQQPSVMHDLQLHAKLEAFVAKYDTAVDAAKALGVSKQVLHAVRNGDRACPPSILRALGLVRLPPGRTLYREV